jgi:hypothetical protein
VALSQLEKQYEEWLFQMHDRYDEVIERGEDQPLLVVSPLNKKKLAISSDGKVAGRTRLFLLDIKSDCFIIS